MKFPVRGHAHLLYATGDSVTRHCRLRLYFDILPYIRSRGFLHLLAVLRCFAGSVCALSAVYPPPALSLFLLVRLPSRSSPFSFVSSFLTSVLPSISMTISWTALSSCSFRQHNHPRWTARVALLVVVSMGLVGAPRPRTALETSPGTGLSGPDGICYRVDMELSYGMAA